MTYNISRKPVCVALPEGEKMLLNRNALSEFRREHRQMAEGDYGPWKKGEARGEFIALRALEWKMGIMFENLRAKVQEQKGEWETARRVFEVKRRRFDEAQKAFCKNSEKAENAIIELNRAIIAHHEAREAILACLHDYMNQAVWLETHRDSFSPAPALPDALLGRMENSGQLFGRALIASQDRIDETLEIVEQSQKAEKAAEKMSMDDIASFVNAQQEHVLGKIRIRGLGRNVAMGNLMDYLAADLRKYDEKAKRMKEESAAMRKTIRRLSRCDDVVSGGHRKLAASISENNFLDILDAMDGIGKIDEDGIEASVSLIDAENQIYRSVRALCQVVQKADSLEEELIDAYGEYAIAKRREGEFRKRFEKNDAHLVRIYGRGGRVGLLQLAAGGADAAAFKAEKKTAPAAVYCPPLVDEGLGVAENEGETQPGWKWEREMQPYREAAGQVNERTEYFTPVLTMTAKKDLKWMDPTTREKFIAEMGRIPRNTKDEFLFSRGVQAFSHRVSDKDRIVYVKINGNAAIWRAFNDHDRYQQWGKEIEHGTKPEYYAIRLIGNAADLIIFGNKLDYERWKKNGGNGNSGA